ncbi:F-box associated domain, type 1 [Artemisia annua]|uniref:F-box associated domain, type 1 n=1 Tax=Artemisia annua TaxID=35608 RepID=A0A2U1KR70_ARTAN|nr:F-box associated domain, type 1 [Artemisia annua]
MCDILSRLPVKSIITCKCICKKWKNLVLDSYFVNLHMSRSPECLLIYQSNNLLGSYSSGSSVLLMRSSNAVILPTASSNGMTCCFLLYLSSCLYHTGFLFAYLIVPHRLIPQRFYHEGLYHGGYGFGVSVKGEHKVIRILGESLKIEVYTLGTDQWRSLDVPKYLKNMELYHGTFFEDQVYWIVNDQLFSFDLDSETFKLFPFPSLPSGETLILLTDLGILNGCLSVLSRTPYELGIWVMKDHGTARQIRKFDNSITLGL